MFWFRPRSILKKEGQILPLVSSFCLFSFDVNINQFLLENTFKHRVLWRFGPSPVVYISQLFIFQMREFLDVGSVKQKQILQSLKSNSNKTWREMAEMWGVGRSMIYFYRSGKNRIPRDHLQNFLKHSTHFIDLDSLPFRRWENGLKEPILPAMCGIRMDMNHQTCP